MRKLHAGIERSLPLAPHPRLTAAFRSTIGDRIQAQLRGGDGMLLTCKRSDNRKFA
jgi:hypothetical protein